MSSEPVTLFISRRVKPGFEAEIEQWGLGIRAACEQFPGYVSSQVLERHSLKHEPSFDVVVSFESFETLTAWEESDERNEWYAKLQPMVEYERVSRLQGSDPWFPPPPGVGVPPPPNKLKMWAMTFLCVYPLVVLVVYGVSPFLPHDIPLWLRLLISVPVVTFLMAFFVMPFLSRAFAKWLYPKL